MVGFPAGSSPDLGAHLLVEHKKGYAPFGTLAGVVASVVAYWVVHGGAAGMPRFALAVSRACPLAGLAQSAPWKFQQRVNSDPTDSWSAKHRQRRVRQI